MRRSSAKRGEALGHLSSCSREATFPELIPPCGDLCRADRYERFKLVGRGTDEHEKLLEIACIAVARLQGGRSGQPRIPRFCEADTKTGIRQLAGSRERRDDPAIGQSWQSLVW